MERKRIKVKLVGFWEGYKPEDNIICRILEKNYDVDYSDKPDYVICGPYWDNGYYSWLEYSTVRIFYSFENYIPDFNFFDYGISTYPLKLYDRHLCFPVCLDAWHNRFELLKYKTRTYDSSILNEKIYFANFIYSHESEDSIRGDFFKKLCEYKHVESPGRYLNNMPDGQIVKFVNDSKALFQRKCKFSLCFESTVHKGFVTEKITDAFFADTIPIYYGSDTVSEIFNPKAFINCSDYSSFDQVIDRIIELDNDDKQYLEMLSQPILVDNELYNRKSSEAERFVRNIFDQPIEKAYRRSSAFWPIKYEEYIIGLRKVNEDVNKARLDSYFSGSEFLKMFFRKAIFRIRNLFNRSN